MEQKRTLWIIVAAGMFLLVVLGAAYLLYSPAKSSYPQNLAQMQPNSGNNSGWTQENSTGYNTNPVPLPPPPVPVLSDEIKTDELTVYSENTVLVGLNETQTPAPQVSQTGTTIDLNTLKALDAESKPQNINITVNIPETNTKKSVSTVAEYPTTNVIVQVPPKMVEDYIPQNVGTKEDAKKSGKSAITQPVIKTSTKKPAEPKPVPPPAELKTPQFWVQCAAYSTKKSAEDARTALDSNKIPADIFTYKDAKGKVFYRVRVGPYTTKSEAEYWKSRIVKIDEFAKNDSYITSN